MENKPTRPLKEILSSGIQEILDNVSARAKEGIDKMEKAIGGLEETLESVLTTPIFEFKEKPGIRRDTGYTEMDLLLRESMHAYRNKQLLKKGQVLRLCHISAEVSAANGHSVVTLDVRIDPTDIGAVVTELQEKYSKVTVICIVDCRYSISIYWGSP